MIFADTSALYAVLDSTDRNHAQAAEAWKWILESETAISTTNYVILELCALVQRRAGLEAVRRIQEDFLPVMDVVWVDETIHSLAVVALIAASRRKLSLVDCVSFMVMRKLSCREAFAFDQHFQEEGFSFPRRQ